MTKGYDPRAVSNEVLRQGGEQNLEISNLKLQKLLFLCHSFFLVDKERPLVHGTFEAWQFGPVHREVYESFRHFGREPITEYAKKVNPATGEVTSIEPVTDKDATKTIYRVVEFYGCWSAGQLIELTHRIDGPWDFTVKKARGHANIGLRISDEIIRERFKYHWFGKPNIEQGNSLNGEDFPIVA